MKCDFAREWAAWSGEAPEAVARRIGRSNDLIAQEWQALVREAVPTPEQARAYYEQSMTYVYATLGSSQFHQDRGLPEELGEWLRRYDCHSLLDYGCGCGGLGLGLDDGIAVTLCEVRNVRTWPFLIDLASRRRGPTEVVAPEHLNGATFDAVATLEVLEHLHNPLATAAWLIGMVRPGGLFLGSWSFEPSDRHEHLPSEYDRFTFRDALRACGALEWIEECPYWAWVFRKR